MKLNKKVFVSVLILAMFILSGCEIYEGEEIEEEGISYIPLEEIIIEETEEEVTEEEEELVSAKRFSGFGRYIG